MVVRQHDRDSKASKAGVHRQMDGRVVMLRAHAGSILAAVLGSLLVAWSFRENPSLALTPQDEPLVRSRGAHHVFSTGERVSLIDFFAADVRRARRGEPRLANQPVLTLTEVESRRRRFQSRELTVGKHGGITGAVDVSSRPQDAISLPLSYWRGMDGQYNSAMSIERSTLLSPTMDRILVARAHRALFCPIPGVAEKIITDFLEKSERHLDGKLEKLSSFSLRDRERYLTSKDIFRFAFVRHPFNRAAATYHQGINSGDLDSVEYRDFMGRVRGKRLNEHERELQRLTTLFYLTFLGRQPPETLNETFRPQVNLCSVTTIDYQLLGRLESLDADIATVAEMLNIEPPTQPMSALLEGSESNIKDVADTTHELFRSTKYRTKATKLYAIDFEKLGYSAVDPALLTQS